MAGVAAATKITAKRGQSASDRTVDPSCIKCEQKFSFADVLKDKDARNSFETLCAKCDPTWLAWKVMQTTAFSTAKAGSKLPGWTLLEKWTAALKRLEKDLDAVLNWRTLPSYLGPEGNVQLLLKQSRKLKKTLRAEVKSFPGRGRARPDRLPYTGAIIVAEKYRDLRISNSRSMHVAEIIKRIQAVTGKPHYQDVQILIDRVLKLAGDNAPYNNAAALEKAVKLRRTHRPRS